MINFMHSFKIQVRFNVCNFQIYKLVHHVRYLVMLENLKL
jgi:acyl-CoA thioesterase FadM